MIGHFNCTAPGEDGASRDSLTGSTSANVIASGATWRYFVPEAMTYGKGDCARLP